MSYITVDYDSAYAAADALAELAGKLKAFSGVPELEAYIRRLEALSAEVRQETDEYRAIDEKHLMLGRLERGQ